jgi:VCBS repeat-containing protein
VFGEVSETTPIVVSVHGTDGDVSFSGHPWSWQRFVADPTNEVDSLIVIAPAYVMAGTPGRFNEATSYAKLSWNSETNSAADLALLETVDTIAALGMGDAQQLRLWGYSGGGQFVGRFAAAHPERVGAVVIGGPSSQIYPSSSVSYPYGFGANPQMPPPAGVTLDLNEYLANRIMVWIGQDDNDPDHFQLERFGSVDSSQGTSRLQRALNQFSGLHTAAMEASLDRDSYQYELLVKEDRAHGWMLEDLKEIYDFLLATPPMSESPLYLHSRIVASPSEFLGSEHLPQAIERLGANQEYYLEVWAESSSNPFASITPAKLQLHLEVFLDPGQVVLQEFEPGLFGMGDETIIDADAGRVRNVGGEFTGIDAGIDAGDDPIESRFAMVGRVRFVTTSATGTEQLLYALQRSGPLEATESPDNGGNTILLPAPTAWLEPTGAMERTIQGELFLDATRNGRRDPHEVPISGRQVWIADEEDGEPLRVASTIEPDSAWGHGSYLSDIHPWVRLSVSGSDVAHSGVIAMEREAGQASTGTHVFGSHHVDGGRNSAFSEGRGELHADFLLPTHRVSIDLIGWQGSSFSQGYMTAYDNQGEVIETVTSDLLPDLSQETLTIEREQGDIARVTITGIENRLVRLDHLNSWSALTATTDSDGYFQIRQVPLGSHYLVVDRGPGEIIGMSQEGFPRILVGGDHPVLSFSLDVSDENLPPTITDLLVTAVEDGPSVTYPFAGDEGGGDGSGLALTYEIIAGTGPAEGDIFNNFNGTFTFSPRDDFQDLRPGETRDVFVEYRATDSEGTVSNIATITIRVTGVNDAPVAVDDLGIVNQQNSSITIDVLANDFDPDGSPFDLSSVEIVQHPFSGVAQPNSDGTITYTPNSDFLGQDFFTYRFRDDEGSDSLWSNAALVRVTTTTFPVADDTHVQTMQNEPVEIDIMALVSDADGFINPASVTVVSGPNHGATSIDLLTGMLTYFPDPDYLGADEILYTVRDNVGAVSNPGTISIRVLDPVTPYRNPRNPLDVDDDGRVTAFDVLLIVAFIQENGSGPPSGPVPPYLDVASPDNFVSPFDALVVVSYLNSLLGTGEGDDPGEGEGEGIGAGVVVGEGKREGEAMDDWQPGQPLFSEPFQENGRRRMAEGGALESPAMRRELVLEDSWVVPAAKDQPEFYWEGREGGKRMTSESWLRNLDEVLTHWVRPLLMLLIIPLVVLGTQRVGSAELLGDLPSGLNPTTVIDLLVEARWQQRNVEPQPLCDDRTFVRRVFLDLVGRVPTRTELEDFLKDSESDKRQRLVDQLLDSEDHVRHLAQVQDVILMGRMEGGRNRPRRSREWRDYLERVVRENRPWNDVVAQILLARPEGPEEAGSVWYFQARRDNHQELAEAISAGFFGVQIQCAQCHDHPMASEIEQAHYWGLVAFFRRSKNVDTPLGPRVAESAVGGFEQFTDLAGISRDNLLVYLDREPVEEVRPDADNSGDADNSEAKEEDRPDLYHDVAREGEPAVPLFSRRAEFVDHVVKDHPRVARAFVNRMWALLVGRGLVHPHDQMDSMHPASHPELLDWLAEDFADSRHDVRRLIRHIVLSRPYQLAGPVSETTAGETTAGETTAGETTDGESTAGESTAGETSASVGGSLAEPADFAWGIEKPLMAEVYFRSLLLVLGEGDSDSDSDSDRQSDGERESDGRDLYRLEEDERFRELGVEFRRRFPDLLAEEYVAELQQAMFLSNADSLQQLFLPAEGNLADRLLKEQDEGRRVDEAFETILGRAPDSEERRRGADYLRQRADRPADALRDLLWAIVMSAEFRLNH